LVIRACYFHAVSREAALYRQRSTIYTYSRPFYGYCPSCTRPGAPYLCLEFSERQFRGPGLIPARTQARKSSDQHHDTCVSCTL
jgi:hypothetical protein